MGIIINDSPDRAIRFDLTGKPIAIFDKAHRLGRARFSIGGRAVTEGELAAVFSCHLKLSYRVISQFFRDDTSDTDSKTLLREKN